MSTVSRVRVLHLISDVVRSAYFNALADNCNRERFEVILGTVPPAGVLNHDFSERGLESFSLDCRGRKDYPRGVLRLAGELRRRRVDVLQVHLFDASLVGLAAGRLARVPVMIFTGHHSSEVILRSRPWVKAADAMASRWLSSHVIVHCQQMKDDLHRMQGVPLEKIAVIPLGFDVEHWGGTPGGRERVRAELGLQGKTIIGCIGRLSWVKDYPRLFQCFGKLAARDPRLVLMVVGDGPERIALQELARKVAPADQIVLTGSRGDVPDCLGAMDAFVHASLTESFCQVLVEAQLAGLPLLSTRVGVGPDLIEEGLNGLLVPPGDSDQLQRGMQKLLQLKDRWQQMGQEGRRRALRFSIRRTLAEHEEQYLRWLGDRGHNRSPLQREKRSEA
jgi:L-malate glycosyltransferase